MEEMPMVTAVARIEKVCTLECECHVTQGKHVTNVRHGNIASVWDGVCDCRCVFPHGLGGLRRLWKSISRLWPLIQVKKRCSSSANISPTHLGSNPTNLTGANMATMHHAKRGREYVSRKKEHELDLDVDVHWITEIK
ncbi:hypothetical protein P5673_014285 [Acropora cervicornis]|uniref:Uncharacterized protein n=1 Tax=Acropora cervicornis TaxID=6130 RepID=A0AAD9QKH6_ACRCE|nr:hypothetical protein P5673_014285 [Acropora cervicornis]